MISALLFLTLPWLPRNDGNKIFRGTLKPRGFAAIGAKSSGSSYHLEHLDGQIASIEHQAIFEQSTIILNSSLQLPPKWSVSSAASK